MYSHIFLTIVTVSLFFKLCIILNNENLWLRFHDSFRKHNNFKVKSLFPRQYSTIIFTRTWTYHICNIKCRNQKCKSKKIYGSQPNRTLNYLLCIYSISKNFLSTCVYNKQSPNPHQIPKLHLKSFPFKSNLKIKLMKCFNLVQLIRCLDPIKLIKCLNPTLLHIFHSSSNITFLQL
jgi:hypothetical protein